MAMNICTPYSGAMRPRASCIYSCHSTGRGVITYTYFINILTLPPGALLTSIFKSSPFFARDLTLSHNKLSRIIKTKTAISQSAQLRKSNKKKKQLNQKSNGHEWAHVLILTADVYAIQRHHNIT